MLPNTAIVLFVLISASLNPSAAPLKKKLRFSKAAVAKFASDILADGSIITVTEGDAITIPCEANGTRTPVFHWLFNDEYFEQGPLDTVATNLISPKHSHHSTTVKANLYIKNAKLEHAGKYTCIADSLTKRVTSTFEVVVKERAADDPVVKSSEKPPMIYQWTSSIFQVQGTTLYAVCRATQGHTSAAPKIRWTMNDIQGNEIRQITENENIKIHGNGDLEVHNLDYDFHFWSGTLTCTAINDDGLQVERKDVFVYVIEKEDPAARR